jgi:hypothetical protein
MNNIYDIFPKEIWVLIIYELPCKLIYNLYDVHDQFEELCRQEDIIERRKLKGYPRKSGHCKSYGVCNYIKNYVENVYPIRLILNDTLDRLYEDNTDLVRGDLINFEIDDNDVFLFDGEKIVENYVLHKCILPKDMDIINDNVPAEYWGNTKFGNFSFNFNTVIVKEQLINNIHDDTFSITNGTRFLLNNKKYTILFPKKLLLLEIKEKLNNDEIFLTINSMFRTNTFLCEK